MNHIQHLADPYRHAYDLQAEQFFLGAFAAEQKNPFPELAKDDFYSSLNATLYQAFQNGDFAPDATNLSRYGVDAEAWFSALEATASSAQGDYHGRKIRRLSVRRAAIRKALADLDLLSGPAPDQDRLDALLGPDASDLAGKVKTAAQMAAEALEQYQAMRRGFSCELACMRHVLGLSAPGDHIVIACASSVGKTSLGLQVCDRYRTLFVSGEMPAVNIARRSHAMEYWRMAEMDEVRGMYADEGDQNREFHGAMSSGSLEGLYRDHWLYVTDPVSVPELDRMLDSCKGMDMVLVDYLQLMKGSGEDRRNQMAALARGLKQLAKKHSVRMVSLCQVSRPALGNPMTDPATIPVTLARLKESGDIEESADYVIGMWLHHSRNTGIQAVQDIKNRNAGVHPAAYLKRAGPWFRDASEAEADAAVESPYQPPQKKKGAGWNPSD